MGSWKLGPHSADLESDHNVKLINKYQELLIYILTMHLCLLQQSSNVSGAGKQMKCGNMK